MFTKQFWMETAERGIKTFAQAAGALLVGEGLGVLTVDWPQVASVAGLAAVVSVLTSIGSSAVGDSKSPSLVYTSPEDETSRA